MASGESLLRRQEYRDQFCTETYFVATGTNDQQALMLVDKDTIIDQVSVRVGTVTAAAGTIGLSYVPSGTAISGTNVHITTPLTPNTANTPANTFTDLVVDPTKNVVPAGALIFYDINASTVTSLANIVICIRFRERRRG